MILKAIMNYLREKCFGTRLKIADHRLAQEFQSEKGAYVVDTLPWTNHGIFFYALRDNGDLKTRSKEAIFRSINYAFSWYSAEVYIKISRLHHDRTRIHTAVIIITTMTVLRLNPSLKSPHTALYFLRETRATSQNTRLRRRGGEGGGGALFVHGYRAIRVRKN